MKDAAKCLVLKSFTVLLFILLTSVTHPVKACTAFCMEHNNSFILAKNLDWPVGEGILLVNKRGLIKEAFIKGPKKITWTSRYGSVTFNQFGKEFPLGGMNEAGLVVEELNAWGEVPEGEQFFKINEFQWVQFCLDNFSSISEVLRLKDSVITAPLFLNLHYILADKNNNVLIVEFYEGKSYFYSGNEIIYPVLSNNHYRQSLNYIKNYRGFGGDLETQSNFSGERFVKVALALKNLVKNETVQEVAYNILDKVRQKDTQWSIVYNISKSKISFKTMYNQAIRSLDLDSIDFSCKRPVVYYNILNANNHGNEVVFRVYNDAVNETLLHKVFRALKSNDMNFAKDSLLQGMLNYGNGINCR